MSTYLPMRNFTLIQMRSGLSPYTRKWSLQVEYSVLPEGQKVIPRTLPTPDGLFRRDSELSHGLCRRI